MPTICARTRLIFLILAGFFCDGRPLIQSRADAGWAGWMTSTCAEWVRARRNHPAILVWRPTDVPPPELARFLSLSAFNARLAAEVVRHDPARRPVADGSDIVAWGQPPADPQTGVFTNFRQLQNGAKAGKPFLCKEIWGGFQEPEKYTVFCLAFYKQSFELGYTGMLVQQLPLLRGPGGGRFVISWLSASGSGNRDTELPGRGELPNWCDAQSPASAATPFARLFRDLFQQYMGVEPKASRAPSDGVLLTGLPPRSLALLAPDVPSTAEPRGLLTASDGSAWLVGMAPGTWRLEYGTRSTKIQIAPPTVTPTPGYAHVQRLRAPP